VQDLNVIVDLGHYSCGRIFSHLLIINLGKIPKLFIQIIMKIAKLIFMFPFKSSKLQRRDGFRRDRQGS